MNKRIQELYKQAHITQEKQVRAGGWDNDREPFEYRTVTETNFDPEKFAELIIRECGQAVLAVPCYYKDYRDQIEAAVIRDCAIAVLEHFGVEQ